MSLMQEANALAPMLKQLKDTLHTHPELSFQEHRTTALLKEKLTHLGLTMVDLGMETGVVAVLHGKGAGATVALRADIDAIAQQEPPHEGACSVCDSIMHGCGHDFHTAALYGAAQLLTARKEQLNGTVVFLFQPAEEVTKGAAAMLSHGLLKKLPQKPSYLFGLHNRPEVRTGEIAVIEGPVMSGKSHFVITLHGTAGHGGSPHKCTDVIVAGAAIVTALQTIVSRNTDPMESLVCSVLSIHSGTPDNFVPDTLTMTGSLRAHSDDVRHAAEERLCHLATSLATTYGCTAEVEKIPDVPATVNSPKMTALARKAAAALVPQECIVTPKPDMGSEDFAVLGQEIPSFFYWLGVGNGDGTSYGWHNEHFSTDDSALPLGAALLAQSALTALEESSLPVDKKNPL